MSKMLRFFLAVFSLAFVCAGPAAAQLPGYYVTNIGQLPYQNTLAMAGDALSSSGNYVAGLGCYGANWAQIPTAPAMGFCASASTVNTLSSYVGNTNQWYWTTAPIPLTIGNQPCGVNDSGTVVGQYNGQACYSTLGSTAPTPIPGTSGAIAYGINDSGVIVGDNDGGYSGYMYNMNTQTLTQLPFSALCITNTGLIAGTINGGVQSEVGTAVWQDASGTVHQVASLIQANSIDSTGTYVAGIAEITSTGAVIPGVYDTVTGVTTDIANDNGGNDCAYSVNKYGVVVGAFAGNVPVPPTTGYVYSEAFVYAGGTTQYLGDLALGNAPSGIIWTVATAINDAGQILAQGVTGTRPGVTGSYILTPALPGDANLDGKVDINDLTVVLSNYGQSIGMSWTTGDFIGDGTVDINDLTIVLAHYGDSAGSSAGGLAAVPEPASLILLGLAAVGLPALRGTRRRQR